MTPGPDSASPLGTETAPLPGLAGVAAIHADVIGSDVVDDDIAVVEVVDDEQDTIRDGEEFRLGSLHGPDR
jgi:hypothetical protein